MQLTEEVYTRLKRLAKTSPVSRPPGRMGIVVEHKPENGGYLVYHPRRDQHGPFGWSYGEVEPYRTWWVRIRDFLTGGPEPH